jgi:hypothetical protein
MLPTGCAVAEQSSGNLLQPDATFPCGLDFNVSDACQMLVRVSFLFEDRVSYTSPQIMLNNIFELERRIGSSWNEGLFFSLTQLFFLNG